jgi:hypothetical protein
VRVGKVVRGGAAMMSQMQGAGGGGGEPQPQPQQ